ncbi:TonB-dependent receptor plug domain-containing protein [Fulvivirga maritima]|uniref:TonB-dependent receptor plug domain-containing protein n=1 Tax=Fulvivirga maritima TaxID=2904247 RepID=UPI001F444C7C|nr:TonB-dependent receptor plug domain-containing protein [Fulvivirga maritima]UII28793.1 TonB-dependent receptor plug domain-containing protein [Fulvivirga maritima]
MKGVFVYLIFIFLCPHLVSSQVKPDSTLESELTLEELMNIPIAVASSQALSPRESPGIVSLITADDIAKSGARDMIDVLRTVPGFQLGMDVSGVLGIGIRGNWAFEGKVLILLDGHEMNETSYATTSIGDRFPLDQIERIEIIRGPGSALYGGYAELGVINIISKKAENISGASAAISYGQMQSDFGRFSSTVMVGKELGDFAFDAKITSSKHLRSNRTYTDIVGSSYDMTDYSDIKNIHINGGFSYKGLSLRLLHENHIIEQRDLFYDIMPEAINLEFETTAVNIKYNWVISDKVNIIPQFQYKDQSPWKSYGETAQRMDELGYIGSYSYREVSKISGNIKLNVDFNPSINLISGVEVYENKGEFKTGVYQFNSSPNISFQNLSIFSQALFKTSFANITVGARFNDHEQFGSSFVPRVAMTKTINNFHFKLLASQAFRAPSIQNIDSNTEIDPEQTSVLEVEAGYKLTENMLITANLFKTVIDDPIVYFYDVNTDTEGYDNFNKTGSQGIELVYIYQSSRISANLNYSYYLTKDNKVESYKVPRQDNMMLGFAKSQINLLAGLHITDNFTINPSATYLGKRYGYSSIDDNFEPVLEEFDPVHFVNVYLNYNNLFVKNLDVGVGVHNLTNNDYSFIQPYNSGHAPLPSKSTEYGIKLVYKVGF